MNEMTFRQSFKQEGDCLVWTRARGTSKGYTYGYVMWEGRGYPQHRVAFLLAHGRWPDGVVHHECRNTLCGNPDHLREMSRSDHTFEHNKGTRTHCKYGHEYTEKNTEYPPNGGRICIECRRTRQRHYARRKYGYKNPYRPD